MAPLQLAQPVLIFLYRFSTNTDTLNLSLEVKARKTGSLIIHCGLPRSRILENWSSLIWGCFLRACSYFLRKENSFEESQHGSLKANKENIQN